MGVRRYNKKSKKKSYKRKSYKRKSYKRKSYKRKSYKRKSYKRKKKLYGGTDDGNEVKDEFTELVQAEWAVGDHVWYNKDGNAGPEDGPPNAVITKMQEMGNPNLLFNYCDGRDAAMIFISLKYISTNEERGEIAGADVIFGGRKDPYAPLNDLLIAKSEAYNAFNPAKQIKSLKPISPRGKHDTIDSLVVYYFKAQVGREDTKILKEQVERRVNAYIRRITPPTKNIREILLSFLEYNFLTKYGASNIFNDDIGAIPHPWTMESVPDRSQALADHVVHMHRSPWLNGLLRGFPVLPEARGEAGDGGAGAGEGAEAETKALAAAASFGKGDIVPDSTMIEILRSIFNHDLLANWHTPITSKTGTVGRDERDPLMRLARPGEEGEYIHLTPEMLADVFGFTKVYDLEKYRQLMILYNSDSVKDCFRGETAIPKSIDFLAGAEDLIDEIKAEEVNLSFVKGRVEKYKIMPPGWPEFAMEMRREETGPRQKVFYVRDEGLERPTGASVGENTCAVRFWDEGKDDYSGGRQLQEAKLEAEEKMATLREDLNVTYAQPAERLSEMKKSLEAYEKAHAVAVDAIEETTKESSRSSSAENLKDYKVTFGEGKGLSGFRYIVILEKKVQLEQMRRGLFPALRDTRPMNKIEIAFKYNTEAERIKEEGAEVVYPSREEFIVGLIRSGKKISGPDDWPASDEAKERINLAFQRKKDKRIIDDEERRRGEVPIE